MKVPVLVPKIFNYPLTYDSGSIKNLRPGDFVIVPFGKDKEIGIIWDKIEESRKNFKIKSIEERIQDLTINESLINFINWFSSYNLISKGKVLKMFLGNKNNVTKIEKKQNFKNNIVPKSFLLNNEQKKSLKDLRSYGNTFNVFDEMP